MPKQIRKVTYGPNSITTALPYRDVREAMALAERHGYMKAVDETQIPERLLRLYATDDTDLARARRWLEQAELTEQERRWGFNASQHGGVDAIRILAEVKREER